MAIAMDALWRGAVGVVPLGIMAGLLLRFLHCRPATKHCIWATVLVWALLAPLLPSPPRAETLESIVSIDIVGASSNSKPSVSNSNQDLIDVEAPIANDALVSPPRLKARTVPVAPESLAQADGAVGLPMEKVELPWHAPIAVPAIRGSEIPIHDGLVASEDAVCLEELRAIWQNLTDTSRFNRERKGFPVQGPAVSNAVPTLRIPIGARGGFKPPRIADVGQDPRWTCSAPATIELSARSHDELAWNKEVPGTSIPKEVEPPGLAQLLGTIQVPIPADDDGSMFPSTGKWSASGIEGRNKVDTGKSVFSAWSDACATFTGGVRAWYVDMAALTSGVMATLPPVPAEVWMLGIAVLFCAKLSRILKCRSLLGKTRTAPSSVAAEVRAVACALGLNRVPQVLMVDANVSPMVWCGRGIRLVLPMELWSQLDTAGRRAVLCHELAHLKRRDHWMLWLDQVAAVVYWWHPVVWWVRRRVHEEAENSCDAWVTWLLPQGRRAYAQALLRTTEFVQCKASAAPIAGIGVVSGRAERFARRIKMVMTESAKPRLSGAGVVMALALALGGWLAAPARSCPEDKNHGQAKAVGGCAGKCAKNCAKGGCAHGGPASHAAHGATAVAGVVKLAGDHGEGKHDSRGELEERLDKLESELERLTEQLERIGDKLGDSDDDAPKMKRRRGAGGSAQVVPAPPSGVWEVPVPPQPGTPIGADDAPIVVRAYQLAPGKLEAVTELMVRPDVPIRVRPLDGRIEVQASERNQAIFKGFIDLISDKKQVRAYRVTPGKLEQLNELMVRSDVPILVEPGDEVIKLHGSSLEQSVFGAFVEMIDPGASVREAAVPELREAPAAPRAPRMPREPRAPRSPRGAQAGVHAGPCGGNPEKCREMELKLSQAIREAQNKAQEGMRKLEESQQRLRERTHEQRKNWKQKREKRADGEPIDAEEAEAAAAMEVTVERLSEVIDVNRINQLIEVLAATDVRAALSAGAENRAEVEEQVHQLFAQAEVLANQAREMEEQAQQLDAQESELEAQAEVLQEELAVVSEQQAAEAAEAADAELVQMAAGPASAELEMRAQQLRLEAMAIAEQQGAIQGAAESLFQQSEALHEAAEALHSTMEEEASEPDGEAEVEIEEG